MHRLSSRQYSTLSETVQNNENLSALSWVRQGEKSLEFW